MADKAADATETTKADQADVTNKPCNADKATAVEANEAKVDEADAKANEIIVVDATNYVIVADNANGAVLFSPSKYSAIFAEVKGYFEITAPDNQLGRRSLCSLRSKNQYQLDNQLDVVVEKGLV